MFKLFVRLSVMILPAAFIISCSSSNNKPVLIGFSADSTAIVFSGVDPAGLLQVRNTPYIDTAYHELISVSQTPSDRDSISREMPVPGKVRVTDSTLVFYPSAPFIRGKDYLVLSYMNVRFGTPEMIASGKLNYKIRPEQVILSR